MHFTEYDVRLAAYAVIVAEQKVLLTWYNGLGRGVPCWSLPGGGIEFDETPEQAVVREAYEETGFHVALGEYLGNHQFVMPLAPQTGRPYKSLRLFYRATVVGGSLGTVESGGSTDRAEWWDLAAIDGLEAKADIVDMALGCLNERMGR